MNEQKLYEKLRDRVPGAMETGRCAAVLLPFVQTAEGWNILLEERSARLHSQPGEVCLPGGQVEEDETPCQAALRESCEELLVKPEQITVLGQGDWLCTPGGLTIYPFWGVLKDYTGSFFSEEVADTFTVPVRWLMEHEPQSYLTRITTCPEANFPYERVPGGKDYPWRQGHWPVYFYDWPDREIWGITAKILYHSLQLLKELDKNLEHGQAPDPCKKGKGS